MSVFSRRKQLAGLVGWFVAVFIVAALGAAASVQATAFYGQLIQPDWAPPAWVFGPAWTSLFVLMAVAAWLVWRVDGFQTGGSALTLFLVQLCFNALWSWLFFAWHLGALAFVDVLVLWVLITATILLFWRISALAGLLLVPYLLWVSFAAALNFTVWQLNPNALG